MWREWRDWKGLLQDGEEEKERVFGECDLGLQGRMVGKREPGMVGREDLEGAR